MSEEIINDKRHKENLAFTEPMVLEVERFLLEAYNSGRRDAYEDAAKIIKEAKPIRIANYYFSSLIKLKAKSCVEK